MAQLADQLRGLAPGYIRGPVIDETGLEGGYDFTLSFSPPGMATAGGGRGMVRGGDAPVAGGDTLAASEPSNALTLFEAIDRQLGLKLEQRKHPTQVLVIDHIDPKPTEN